MVRPKQKNGLSPIAVSIVVFAVLGFMAWFGHVIGKMSPTTGGRIREPIQHAASKMASKVENVPVPLTPAVDDKASREAMFRVRGRAALLGAFVADAASMSLHWIYEPGAIKAAVGDKDPEFFDPPQCPFYTYPLGSLTPYGDEALPTLQSATTLGYIDGPQLTKDLAASFEAYTGRLNAVSKDLVKAVQAGKVYPDAAASNNQAHSLVKVPIVVARYGGTTELKEKVLEATRSHQKSSEAEDYAVAFAVILEKVLFGATVEAALTEAQATLPASVQDAFKAARGIKSASEITQSVQKFGPSCHLPGSFQGPIVVASHVHTYVEAVRANILAGGDQASRAHVVGALLAGQHGISAIPEAWQSLVLRWQDIEVLVDALLAQRPAQATAKGG